MYYCYETLRKYYDADQSLGRWNGRDVYACPKKELYKKLFDYYYIVYDDERMGKFPIVRANRLYGLVSEVGAVEECQPTEEYLYPTPPVRKKAVEEEKEAEDSPNMENDTQENIDYPSEAMDNQRLVDEMLEKARTITIEELVGEFCYEQGAY